MIDYSKLVVSEDVLADPIVKVLKRKIRVRKPNRTEFFRCRSGKDFGLGPLMIVEIESEIYLVDPKVADHLEGHICQVELVLSCSRQGDVFIFPVKYTGPTCQDNIWFRTAREAVVIAKHSWVRMTAKNGKVGYDITVSKIEIPEPEWPEQGFEELLDIAFAGRIIDTSEHRIIRELEGLQ